MGRVGVGPLWTILYALFPGVLISQSVLLYSQQQSMCQPWIFSRKVLFPYYHSNVLNTEVAGLLMKGVICEVGQVQGECVRSYFEAPKYKRSPNKGRQILNLKKINKYVCHVYFCIGELKIVRKGFQ